MAERLGATKKTAPDAHFLRGGAVTVRFFDAEGQLFQGVAQHVAGIGFFLRKRTESRPRISVGATVLGEEGSLGSGSSMIRIVLCVRDCRSKEADVQKPTVVESPSEVTLPYRQLVAPQAEIPAPAAREGRHFLWSLHDDWGGLRALDLPPDRADANSADNFFKNLLFARGLFRLALDVFFRALVA